MDVRHDSNVVKTLFNVLIQQHVKPRDVSVIGDLVYVAAVMYGDDFMVNPSGDVKIDGFVIGPKGFIVPTVNSLYLRYNTELLSSKRINGTFEVDIDIVRTLEYVVEDYKENPLRLRTLLRTKSQWAKYIKPFLNGNNEFDNEKYMDYVNKNGYPFVPLTEISKDAELFE